MERSKIKIETVVRKPIEKVWEIWTLPKHIMEWNSASDDWYTPSSENDLRVGGAFSSVMSARDGSFQFEFGGIYDEVVPNTKIAYTLGDGRKVEVTFEATDDGVKVTEVFEAEGENSVEMQKSGWQSILDHFRRYAEQVG